MTPIFNLKMAKLCKSDLINEFLDLKNYSGKNFSKISKKYTWPNLTSKIKILTFNPIFDPENGKIMQIWHDQWISRPQKLFWWKFQPNRRKKIFKCCYKKRKFSKNSVVTKSVVTKSGDFLLQKAYFWSRYFQGRFFS